MESITPNGMSAGAVARALIISSLALGLGFAGCAGGGPDVGQQSQAQQFADPTQCASLPPAPVPGVAGRDDGVRHHQPGVQRPGGRRQQADRRSLRRRRQPSPLLPDAAIRRSASRSASSPPTRTPDGQPSRDFAGEVAATACPATSATRSRTPTWPGSLLGDGIANAAFVLAPGLSQVRPVLPTGGEPYHASSPSDFLRSSEFCGTCHDVRLPGTDAVTGEPFLRLENAFTEWQQRPVRHGRQPVRPGRHLPGLPHVRVPLRSRPEPTSRTAPRRSPDAPMRQVVDALLHRRRRGPDRLPRPGRRRARLATGSPSGKRSGGPISCAPHARLSVDVPDTVAARAASCRSPSPSPTSAPATTSPPGFSQERQMWIELTVTDADGALVYRVGLPDRQPSSRNRRDDARTATVDDEDLQNLIGSIDPVYPGGRHRPRPGRRPAPRRQPRPGQLRQRVQALTPDGERGGAACRFSPTTWTTRTRFRRCRRRGSPTTCRSRRASRDRSQRLRCACASAPSRRAFCATLAQARPDLVDEALVDRNRIVDMAETQRQVALAPR